MVASVLLYVITSFLDVSITLSPMSNPKFFLGKPTNQARYYSEILTRVFEKYVILCIL